MYEIKVKHKLKQCSCGSYNRTTQQIVNLLLQCLMHQTYQALRLTPSFPDLTLPFGLLPLALSYPEGFETLLGLTLT